MMKFEERWVRTVLSSFAPKGSPGLAPQDDEVNWTDAFERMRRVMNPVARLGVRASIWMANFAPLWTGRKLGTLESLPPPERAELLAKLLEHDVYLVRELSMLLKIGASFAFLGTPSVRARAGYDVSGPLRPPKAHPPLNVVSGTREVN